MTYEIRGPVHDDIWVISYEGPVRKRDRQQALAECIKRTEERPIGGVLVDFRGATCRLSTYDEFSFATEVTAKPELTGIRIAFLQPEDIEGNDLFLTAAQNRGLLVRVFHDEDDAWSFLRSKPSQPRDE